MDVSRRGFLATSVAVLPMRPRQLSVSCTLAESNRAFGEQPPRLPQARVKHLVESAAGYEAEDLSWLNEHGIQVGQSVPVQSPAWIRYTWPTDALIRDFGRACPVAGGRVIARLGDMPVAVRRGRFIVLGSPLGPHLYAGDRDAHRLFEAFLRSSL
ncbi:MAG TPA: hypothetical protein VFA04_03600 [Bryobacteraceae bacterium]|nr:hypothetical protein [Bryobacteraceae bacterium]